MFFEALRSSGLLPPNRNQHVLDHVGFDFDLSCLVAPWKAG